MDATYIAALERELEHAKRTKGGGQPPDRDRIRVITAELRRARGEDALETADGAVLETAEAPRVKQRREQG